jgi:rhamnulokinase
MKTVLAVDLGAESGRVMAARYDGQRLELEELHRFPNVPIAVDDAVFGETLCWDVRRLWGDIQGGLARGRAAGPASIGVDTWGVDFALLDAAGALLGPPVHYRDRRTEGVMEQVVARVGRATIFEQTGIQFMPINTLYQLASLAARQAPQLGLATTLLTMPDLFNYWLTGARACERTNASTTQLYNPQAGRWAYELMEAVGLPPAIFPEIIPPGTLLGRHEGVPVIAPGCHDTASAVAGVPARGDRFCYISSGTWSLVGLELPQPIIGPQALAANVTNEAGVYGTTRLLKNVMGLWILQQCRATWQAQGHDYSYAELARLAEQAPPLRSLFRPNAPRLLPAGDHPAHVRALCAEAGQPLPEGHGALVRCVLESLALAYREVIETLRALSGRAVDVIHMVGGGIHNELLCQMAADATGLPVLAGPAEATVLGNVLVQLIALGELASLEEGRELVARSFAPRRYEPRHTQAWDAAYAEFLVRSS